MTKKARVSVSLKEGPGRVVEGKASEHSLAVDLTRAMGKEGKNRLCFPSLKISVKMDSPLSEKTQREFLKKVASLCPVCDTIEGMTPIQLELAPETP
jgi:uncharacterized OsmC-like protein